MNEPALQMTAELADELASNERRQVDTRTMPARFHNLRAMAMSAAHGRASFDDWEGRDSLALKLGAGTHAMLFDQPHVMFGGKVRRGKEWEAFAADHAGKIILNRKEWKHAEAVVASIRRNEIAMRLMFGPGTVREETILWEMAGRTRRSTPDVRGPFHVVELKTARCGALEKFTRDAGYRCYHAQLADQCLAVEALTGSKPTEVYIVCVETAKPYVVTVRQLTDHTIAKGERLITAWMGALLEAERTGKWPGYSDKVEMLDIPDDTFDTMFVDEDGGQTVWSTDDPE